MPRVSKKTLRNQQKREYAKENYKYITFKLRLDNDKDIIDYLESLGGNRSEYLRKILAKDVKEKAHGNKFRYVLLSGVSGDGDEDAYAEGTYTDCKAKMPDKETLAYEMRKEYEQRPTTIKMFKSWYYYIRREEIDEDGDLTETDESEVLDYISMTFEEALHFKK